jgi:hypothetical protein
MTKIFAATLFLGLASISQAAFHCLCTAAVHGCYKQQRWIGSIHVLARRGNDAGAIDDNVAGDGYNVVGLKLLLGGSFQDAGAEPGTIFSVLYTSSNALLAGQNPGNPSCTASATTSENNFALGACSDMTNGGAFYAIAPTDVLERSR